MLGLPGHIVTGSCCLGIENEADSVPSCLAACFCLLSSCASSEVDVFVQAEQLSPRFLDVKLICCLKLGSTLPEVPSAATSHSHSRHFTDYTPARALHTDLHHDYQDITHTPPTTTVHTKQRRRAQCGRPKRKRKGAKPSLNIITTATRLEQCFKAAHISNRASYGIYPP